MTTLFSDTKKNLAILIAILSGVSIYRVMTDASSRAVMSNTQTPAHVSLRIRLDRLTARQKVAPDPVRNLFAPLPDLPPPPPLEPEIEEPLPPPIVEEPSLEDLVASAARKALGEIKYIGFLDRGDGHPKGVFLKDRHMQTGGIGGNLFERFLVKEVSYANAQIEETQTRLQVTLPLSPRP